MHGQIIQQSGTYRRGVVLGLTMAEIMLLLIFHGLYDGVSIELMLRHVVSEYFNVPGIQHGPNFVGILPHLRPTRNSCSRDKRDIPPATSPGSFAIPTVRTRERL